jgi:hypothetical protein
MAWNICISDEAKDDFRKIDGSVKGQVATKLYEKYGDEIFDDIFGEFQI